MACPDLVNATTPAGVTPLMTAATGRRAIASIDVLVAAGASLDVWGTSQHQHVLLYAIAHGAPVEVVDCLWRHDAERGTLGQCRTFCWTDADATGRGVLPLALSSGNVALVQHLVHRVLSFAGANAMELQLASVVSARNSMVALAWLALPKVAACVTTMRVAPRLYVTMALACRHALTLLLGALTALQPQFAGLVLLYLTERRRKPPALFNLCELYQRHITWRRTRLVYWVASRARGVPALPSCVLSLLAAYVYVFDATRELDALRALVLEQGRSDSSTIV
ncbi:hypothetical protein SPRG_00170 [Saprolegnia parasitica CBS 223.65]|uniref:Uncharacterized protein n=1 Tax=Saprolegnia parasitica (strain CBS 223.65) TaxID=695850 RepID=A0A067D9J6_SAPPC|nr:hypothetical protein SPRG_00170 [Saprolegnia parasitica CBS 223.65]KDO35321.1 hypothetical protein SPRG_00170 [Saprolegnia parasitica CBS 223.65]|eukprot:XP_012193667.1 hypothetical protein SPRG_00170 [Saprolegnia parasitica CBS 223.65]